MDDDDHSDPFIKFRPSSINDLISTERTQEILGIKYGALRRRVIEGRFHPIRKGKKLYFDPHEIKMDQKRVAESYQKRAVAFSDHHPPKSGSPPPPTSSAEPNKNQLELNLTPRVITEDLPNEGEISAKAFSLFKKKTDICDAVIELRQPVRIVKHLYDEWKSLTPEWNVSETDMKLLTSALDWDESPPTFDGLFKAINYMVGKKAEVLARDMIRDLHQEQKKAGANGESVPLVPVISDAEKKALEALEDLDEQKKQ
jgi:hypothetical protein